MKKIENPRTAFFLYLEHQPEGVNTAHLFFYEDVWEQKPPKDYKIEYFNGEEGKWLDVQHIQKQPETPVGNSLNMAIFNEVKTSKMRIIVTHLKKNNFTALYELELFGNN